MKSKGYYGIGNDEYRYYKTLDNGKTWTYIAEGNGSLVIKDDRMIIDGGFSDDNLATINKGKSGEVFKKDGDNENVYMKVDDIFFVGHDRIYSSNDGFDSEIYSSKDGFGGGIYSSKDGEIWERVGPIDRLPLEEDPLLYLLNDVIIYNLTNMLANEHDLNKLNYYNYEGPTSFFTNSQIYKTEIDGIDYISDVGMRPFSESDLVEYQEIKDIQEKLKEEFLEDPTEAKIDIMLQRNKSLKKTFQIIDLKLNNLKTLMQKRSIKDIKSRKEDYEGISPEDIDLMKNFYEVRKGTEGSIVGTILNSIFAFNNSKKLALLKMSILESAMLLKEDIQSKLSLLSEKYNRNITTEDVIGIEEIKNMFNFNLKETWGEGLELSVRKYYHEAMSNILSITENEDRELIYIASEEYKTNRSYLLSEASNKLRLVSHIDKDFTFLKEEINIYASDYYDAVKNSDKKDETILKLFEEYKINNQKALENCSEEFNKIAKKYRLDFLNNLKDIKITYFSREDYEEELDQLSYDAYDRVYNYYDEIIDKFKSRCHELYGMIGSQTIDKYIIPYINLENLINKWTEDLIDSKDKNTFINNNNIPLITNEINEMINDMDYTMMDSWNGAKELI